MTAVVPAGVAGVAGLVLCGLLIALWRGRPRRGPARPRRTGRGPARSKRTGRDPARSKRTGRGPVRSKRASRHRDARPRATFDRFVEARPKLFVLLTALLCGGTAELLGGPVAAALGVIYATAGAIAWRRRIARLRRDRAYAALLNAIGNTTGDLRAGLVPEPLPAVPAAEFAADPAIVAAVARLAAAHRISEALGAPLADLMDRVDTDLRNGQRLGMTVRAQAAGTQATALILTSLPLIGIVLGITMGVNPAAQLLYTRVGAGCSLSAALLQCGGLALTAAMVRGVVAEVRA